MRDGKKVVITYGTYDLLHYGHIALLERARALGDYLIVGVTSDAFDRSRGKLNVHQSLSDRLQAVAATGLVDEIVVEEYQGQKISDIKKYGVDIFAIGSDWEGKFDYLNNYCKVVYLPRTEGVSSTELRAERIKTVKIGCIGSGYLMGRFISESAHVAGVELVGGFALPEEAAPAVRDAASGGAASSEAASASDSTASIYLENDVPVADDLQALLAESDAVYIVAPIDEHRRYIEAALEAGRHVLCESPLFLSVEDMRDMYALADERGLVLMEALKTRYFPAYDHLKLMLESGVVGEVKDIDASFSHVFDALDMNDRYQGSFYDMASYICLPAVSFLGSDFVDSQLICAYEGDFCTWAKCNLLYPSASATLRVGRGMKTEGDMVITGTKGYIYVPAPWWKIDYFEVRTEDLRNTKKYYYECVGQGQRYELFEFVHLISQKPADRNPQQGRDEVEAVTELMAQFHANEVSVLGHGRYAFGGGERVDDR